MLIGFELSLSVCATSHKLAKTCILLSQVAMEPVTKSSNSPCLSSCLHADCAMLVFNIIGIFRTYSV